MVKQRRNRRNNNNGFASTFAARPGIKSMIFQDTVASEITVSETANTFVFTSEQLIPSFGLITRIYVPRCIFVECLPTTNTESATMLQLQIPATWGGNRTSTGLGLQPYKMLSAVNPTRLKLDFVAAQRILPYVRRPGSTTDNEDLLQIRSSTRLTGADTSAITLRITTVVDILTQETLGRKVPTTLLSRQLDFIPGSSDRRPEIIDPSTSLFSQHDSSCACRNTQENRCNSEETGCCNFKSV